MNKNLPVLLTATLALVSLSACDSGGGSGSPDSAATPPNILFVIMDDVGIDQMRAFGYGGLTPPHMPNMDAVAHAGLRFRNTWSMPECSPGRAAFFLGQYPHRTNIRQAIGPNDLAVSQVSPFATTAPKLLKQANYESAMFGKFHLAGPENNEAVNSTPAVLGWDYFYGWVGGLPGSVDTTAGGVAPDGTYSCGFVPSRHAGGADFGACYTPDNMCTEIRSAPNDLAPAGLQCLDAGGILVPHRACGVPPSGLKFDQENGYYVSPLVIIDKGHVEEVSLSDPRARRYRTRIETDAAIEWIKGRSPGKPWMATVSYSAAHTPWQQPPPDLLPGITGPTADGLDCKATAVGRMVQNRMTEALDTEFGRLLVETGLASRGPDGRLVYDPTATNTVIVIAGDNGSLAAAVKEPFEPTQAKGTTYQTGVWAPLIVAGPQVEQPGREVDHMVNMVDLFQLFAEIAEVEIPDGPQVVDSAPVLPYLTNPDQPSIRQINFAMAGFNYQANGGSNGPCVISTACTQIPTSKSVCEDNQGEWWGPGYKTDGNVIDNGGVGYATCGEVNQALYGEGRPMLNILAEDSAAIRDTQYKYVRNLTRDFKPETGRIEWEMEEGLYQINQAVPRPLLDTPDRNLLSPNPTPEITQIYERLKRQMEDILASQPECRGDGNLDGMVDGRDLEEWSRIAREWGLSSVYDFKLDGVFDGLTNTRDREVIQANLGTPCAAPYAVY